MKKTSKIVSIILTVIMLMGLMTSMSFAAEVSYVVSDALPTTFGWSTDNAGYITIDVPAFDGEEIEYLLDLYKDGVKVSDDFGVYFDESGEFESEIFANKIEELGNGTYKYKIGFERDFDTDILVGETNFSDEYVVDSYSHSVKIEPVEAPATAPTTTPAPVTSPVTESASTSNNTVTAPQTEAVDDSPKTLIKGQVVYSNKYQSKSANASIIYGETKPLAKANVMLYKKNGVGNTRPLTKTSTDLNGNFELSYKPGNYDLIIYYGDSKITVNVNAANEQTDLGMLKFEPNKHKSFSTQPELILPYDAKVIEITTDNLNNYFEDVTVIGEVETDSSRIGTVKSYGNNVYCGITLPQEMHPVNLYDVSAGYGSFDEENELWLIAPNNAKEFINMKNGPSNQICGIYDEKHNVLYHSTIENNGSGYVFSHFGKNGTVSITKYSVNSFGVDAKYKLTHMTARFKNLPYVTVSYNGELINFDQKPIIENGRTLVPLRAIFEKIGATVDWNGDTQTVTATKDDITISLTINNTTAYKNGETVALDVPAKIINGRTLVPVRFVSDCFGVNVDWDGIMQKVILTK